MEHVTKMAPKSIPGIHQNPYFSRPCPKVDFWMHFGRPLAPFGLPFCSPWPLLDSLWLTFGSLWRTFGSLLLTFGSLCLPFGSLLRPFGSLWLSPGLIFHIFMYFLRTCRAKSFLRFLMYFSSKIKFSVNQIVLSRSAPNNKRRQQAA